LCYRSRPTHCPARSEVVKKAGLRHRDGLPLLQRHDGTRTRPAKQKRALPWFTCPGERPYDFAGSVPATCAPALLAYRLAQAISIG